ncbi:MAG: isochorismatase family protein [bacterium]|nr:isochorismatase family protein [bacterium]
MGLTVIHAPSPRVVESHHPDHMPTAEEAPAPETWPPASFRGLYRSGAFGRNREPRLDAAIARYVTELKISDLAKPIAGEPIIATGDQLHQTLKQRKVLHVFYAGFATNWCVINRDYGLIATCNRGYNVILLRDATTGVEFHDSVDTLTATEIAIREIETKYGWSALTDDLIVAGKALS